MRRRRRADGSVHQGAAADRPEAQRSRWHALDEVAGELWSLPPSRVKNNRLHSVPLSRQVLAIIEAVPRIGDHVFTINGATP